MGTLITIEAIPATESYADKTPREHTINLWDKVKGELQSVGAIEVLADGNLKVRDEKSRHWIVYLYKIWEELNSINAQ